MAGRYGAEYNPDRYEAFARVRLVSTLNEVLDDIRREEQGKKLYTVATDARLYPNTIEYTDVRKRLDETDDVFLLLFGTGWGLLKEEMEKSGLYPEAVYGLWERQSPLGRSQRPLFRRLRGKLVESSLNNSTSKANNSLGSVCAPQSAFGSVKARSGLYASMALTAGRLSPFLGYGDTRPSMAVALRIPLRMRNAAYAGTVARRPSYEVNKSSYLKIKVLA